MMCPSGNRPGRSNRILALVAAWFILAISMRAGKWTLGPGLAVIKQTEYWSCGVLVNHVWSFAGDKNRSAVSITTIEPTVSYTWGKAWTVGLDDTSTYDSVAASGSRWIEPLQLSISKVTNFGSRPVNLSVGVTPCGCAGGFSECGSYLHHNPTVPEEVREG
jgi:hypothetical protein